nr:hypothetical protein [Kibdelosporangium sp. MJ126-NF4]CTQ96897.1 hypothetical protein [Kibdelosporangium sp. MJ126-NF4]
MYHEEGRQPWVYYGPMVRAIRQALVDPAPRDVLQAAVDKVTDPAKRANFAELCEGAMRFIGRSNYTLVPVKAATWLNSEAAFNVAPHLGLRPRTGSGAPLAVVLYMKSPVLRQEAANIPLYMMRQVMPDLLLDGKAAILDVRRGDLRLLSSHRTQKRLEADVAGVVAHWTAIWRAIA